MFCQFDSAICRCLSVQWYVCMYLLFYFVYEKHKTDVYPSKVTDAGHVEGFIQSDAFSLTILKKSTHKRKGIGQIGALFERRNQKKRVLRELPFLKNFSSYCLERRECTQ